MLAAFFIIVSKLPEDITFTKALDIAGASGKMEILDFSFDLSNRYTIWTGFLGGTFLMLSYFGTDQSQVQRYLSGRSVRESQLGLLFNGLLKVPMQFFILLVGVMVFVFYQFNASPINFNPAAHEAVQNSEYVQEYTALENQLKTIQAEQNITSLAYAEVSDQTSSEDYKALKYQLAQLNKEEVAVREKAKTIITSADATIETNDKDYVFINFILNNLPRGLIGLLLAVILSAAMSSTASELNALASTTAMDLYKRNVTTEKNDMHFVKASKWFTLGWGVLAILVACVANLFDNLIQLVNIIGSIFYGNILGIFLLAFFVKYVKSKATFVAAILTQTIIVFVWYMDYLPYLWLNVLGCGIVMAIAIVLQTTFKAKEH
jgi:Na+/proline symporter